MYAGVAGNLGMQTLTAGAPVAEAAAVWALGDLALAAVAGIAAAIALGLAIRLDRGSRDARMRARSSHGLPALPARG